MWTYQTFILEIQSLNYAALETLVTITPDQYQ
jgi:hypothetical protein